MADLKLNNTVWNENIDIQFDSIPHDIEGSNFVFDTIDRLLRPLDNSEWLLREYSELQDYGRLSREQT